MTAPPAPARRMPDTLLILLAIAALIALLTPWLTPGAFLPGQPISLGSYRPAAAHLPLQLFGSGDEVGFLNFVFDGFTSGGRSSSAIGVIAFVLLVGGAFGVVNASGVMERSLHRLVAATAPRPALLLGALVLAFSTGGAVFGMGEETIAFIALLAPLLRSLGYPPQVVVMVTYLPSQIGFGTSWMNPFSVAVAQGVAGLPLLSGAPLRIAMWACFTGLTLVFVLHHAARHRQPASAAALLPIGSGRIDWSDRLMLLAILATVVWIVWGVTVAGYYIPEIATQFVTLGLVVGAIAIARGRLAANDAAAAFTEGVRQLVPCALVIALAKGLLGLLGGSDPHQPSLLNAALFTLGSGLQHAPPLLAAEGMLLAQSVFNFFVTSGSAQAAITMPLMAGLGDLIGVSRQIAVLAFQLGDGLTNLIIPTSGAMMGAIGMAGLDWLRWLRLIWRLELLLLAAAAGWVALAVLVGYA
ncbi:MAG: putative basic amino acid antiporter YfcC [Xanthomonadales bacterium]|nr:putative basic amino acid antiporter YfcC [Xanthomonadales bacterium]